MQAICLHKPFNLGVVLVTVGHHFGNVLGLFRSFGFGMACEHRSAHSSEAILKQIDCFIDVNLTSNGGTNMLRREAARRDEISIGH